MSYFDIIWPEREKASLDFSKTFENIYLVLNLISPNSKWIVEFDFMRNVLIKSVGNIFALRIDPADFGKGYIIKGRLVSDVCFLNTDVQYDVKRFYYLIIKQKVLKPEQLEEMFGI